MKLGQEIEYNEMIGIVSGVPLWATNDNEILYDVRVKDNQGIWRTFLGLRENEIKLPPGVSYCAGGTGWCMPLLIK